MAANWKGYLRLALVTIPIRMAPATSSSDKIAFNQLNKATGNRVKQQLVDSETGDVVERADIIKGYEFDRGRYIQITAEDLDTVKIESSRVIDIERFVDEADLPAEFLNSPYFLMPDGDLAREAYAVVRTALTKMGKVGLGRVVLSTREHAAAIRVHGEGLTLTTLLSAEEVRQPENLSDLPSPQPDMVQLAETIIKRKEGKWNPAEWRDRYQEALREMIAAKVAGEELPERKIVAPAPNVVNLMDVLRRSVEQESGGADHAKAAKAVAGKKGKRDLRQGEIKLPIAGGKKAAAKAEQVPERPARGRRKAG
jgi:DNA end-binding protein Ku